MHAQNSCDQSRNLIDGKDSCLHRRRTYAGAGAAAAGARRGRRPREDTEDAEEERLDSDELRLRFPLPATGARRAERDRLRRDNERFLAAAGAGTPSFLSYKSYDLKKNHIRRKNYNIKIL